MTEVYVPKVGDRVELTIAIGDPSDGEDYSAPGSVGTITEVLQRVGAHPGSWGFSIKLDGLDFSMAFGDEEFKPHVPREPEPVRDEAYWRNEIAGEITEFAEFIRQDGGPGLGTALHAVVIEVARRVKEGDINVG